MIATATDLESFSRVMKHDPTVGRLRRSARDELHALYVVIANHFGLPVIPLHLPVRKKVRVRGKAFTAGGIPKEIRVYTVEAPAKAYSSWRPTDIQCSSSAEVLDTVIHEAAHILEAVRHGVMSHGQTFTKAYDEIASFLMSEGYAELYDSECSSRLGMKPEARTEQVGRTTPVAERSGCMVVVAVVGALGTLSVAAIVCAVWRL